MNPKHLLITTLTTASLAMGSSQALAAGFFIDSFDVPTPTPPNPDPGSVIGTELTREEEKFGPQTVGGLPIDQVIGGSRTLTYTLVDTVDPIPSARANIFTGSGNFDGFLDIENRQGTTSKAEVEWTDIQSTGQGNFNILGGADDEKGIAIDLKSDGIPFSYSLIISDGMNMSTVKRDFNFMGVRTETTDYITFADIINSGMNTGLDLSMVNYVKLVVEGNLGYDLSITQIGSFEVPEPSTVLGLLAILGTGAFSIKRKTKAQ